MVAVGKHGHTRQRMHQHTAHINTHHTCQGLAEVASSKQHRHVLLQPVHTLFHYVQQQCLPQCVTYKCATNTPCSRGTVIRLFLAEVLSLPACFAAHLTACSAEPNTHAHCHATSAAAKGPSHNAYTRVSKRLSSGNHNRYSTVTALTNWKDETRHGV